MSEEVPKVNPSLTSPTTSPTTSPMTSPKTIPMLKCDVCGKELSSPQALGGHKMTHLAHPLEDVEREDNPKTEVNLEAKKEEVNPKLEEPNFTRVGVANKPTKKEELEPEAKKADFSVADLGELKGLANIKTDAEVAKEEAAQDKALEGIFETISNVWNNVADAPADQAVDYHWTKKDSDNLKNAIELLDAKYGFIGKSLNYVPEMVMLVTVMMFVAKGYAMVKHKRSGERAYDSGERRPAVSGPSVAGMSELDKWAAAEAAKLNSERK
jgi:hypothetical protein